MSYILEALADSEQARQQISAAPKYSLLPAVGEESPQHRRWPYALAGALLINAAVLQVWLRPAPSSSVASINGPTLPHLAEIPAAPEPRTVPSVRSEKPAVDAASIALRETPPQIALRETPPPQPQPERAYDRRVARSVPTAAVPAIAIANSANDSAPVRPLPNAAPKPMAKRVVEAVVATQANPTPSPTPSSPAVSSPTPSSPTLSSPAPASPSLAGGTAAMPPALQKEMPALSVAGFIRDEGSSSMVIVNDRLVREGDEVAPGVKLEKILNETLVFNYKGYRFTR